MSDLMNRYKKAIGLFQQNGGMLRMSEALKLGITRYSLYAMRDAGIIEVLSRGLYRLGSIEGMTNPDLATVARRTSEGVVCLISALSFHEITTQVPHAVDIAIPRDSREPRIEYPPVNVYQFSGNAYSQGIEFFEIDGVQVKVYSAEKSVADIFKYRNKLGMDVAIEAVQLWSRKSKRELNMLWEFSKTCRVEKIIRPYLEALI